MISGLHLSLVRIVTPVHDARACASGPCPVHSLRSALACRIRP